MDVKDILAELFSYTQFGIKLGLGRVRLLLSALGDPQDRFPSIHVAGTNGKGSTAAMAASILQAAGLRVGLYTSPHLCDFSERIRIDDRPIEGPTSRATTSISSGCGRPLERPGWKRAIPRSSS